MSISPHRQIWWVHDQVLKKPKWQGGSEENENKAFATDIKAAPEDIRRNRWTGPLNGQTMNG